MIDYIPPSTVSASTAAGGSSLNGLDVLTSIQILLVSDYDFQLQSMGRQIKGAVEVKKAIRGELEKLQKMMMLPTEKKKINGKKVDCVLLTPEQMNEFKEVLDFKYDTDAKKLLPPDKSKMGDKELNFTEKIEKHQTYNEVTGYYLDKSGIDSKMEIYKEKLATVNEQSELNSLSLQSLANQRKIAFETISNLVNKEHEGVATIVRNIKS